MQVQSGSCSICENKRLLQEEQGGLVLIGLRLSCSATQGKEAVK
jgi:hypothetical protein